LRDAYEQECEKSATLSSQLNRVQEANETIHGQLSELQGNSKPYCNISLMKDTRQTWLQELAKADKRFEGIE